MMKIGDTMWSFWPPSLHPRGRSPASASSTLSSTALEDVSNLACSTAAWLCPSPTDTQPPAAPSLSFPRREHRRAVKAGSTSLPPTPSNLTPISLHPTSSPTPLNASSKNKNMKMDLLCAGCSPWTTEYSVPVVREVQSNTGLYSPIPRSLQCSYCLGWYLPTAAVPPNGTNTQWVVPPLLTLLVPEIHLPICCVYQQQLLPIHLFSTLLWIPSRK